MEARWKRINIQRNQLSICFDTFESNCNTDEQAGDIQAGLAVAVAITLKCICKNAYHFFFFLLPTCNAINTRRKRGYNASLKHISYANINSVLKVRSETREF